MIYSVKIRFDIKISGVWYPAVEERVWVPPCAKRESAGDDDDDAMDTATSNGSDALKSRNRLSDADLDKFLIVARSVGTFARALDCSSSVKQPRYPSPAVIVNILVIKFVKMVKILIITLTLKLFYLKNVSFSSNTQK
jgi:hypothetical protein